MDYLTVYLVFAHLLGGQYLVKLSRYLLIVALLLEDLDHLPILAFL